MFRTTLFSATAASLTKYGGTAVVVAVDKEIEHLAGRPSAGAEKEVVLCS